MKIDDPRSVSSSPNLRPTAPPTQAPAGAEGQRPQQAVNQPAARVELSSRSREMHQALEAANAAPDVRADKVNDAKARIAQGTYSVKAESIARGILDTTA
ncbi:MAG TPA: flagellar biosynthesis anti-sigma factor FlgM [Candidatus Limnocylindrales bacterium]|jgi:flagellar biosynthesis anti-sigma factor FlgM